VSSLVGWRSPNPLDALWFAVFLILWLWAFELIEGRVERLPLVFVAYLLTFAATLAVAGLVRGDDIGVVEVVAALGGVVLVTGLKAVEQPWERWAEQKRIELEERERSST